MKTEHDSPKCQICAKTFQIKALKESGYPVILIDDSDMTWPFKSKPSSPAFAVGGYKIGDSIDTTGLAEFSEMEYSIFERKFKHEQNFHATPVEFLGYSWNLMLGTVAGQLYKIAPYLEVDKKRDADSVALAALNYCKLMLGKPSTKQTGLFIWDTTDGNVILQTAEIAESVGINLFITSRAVREFEQI
jgi:hypothetical protein